jgi:hypothetical protein
MTDKGIVIARNVFCDEAILKSFAANRLLHLDKKDVEIRNDVHQLYLKPTPKAILHSESSTSTTATSAATKAESPFKIFWKILIGFHIGIFARGLITSSCAIAGAASHSAAGHWTLSHRTCLIKSWHSYLLF